MPVYDVPLSVAGIDEIIRELNSFRRKLNEAETKIVQGLADDAEASMRERLTSVTNPDGNVDASVGSVGSGNEAYVYLTGEQAAYLEFGTGVVGESSRHTMAGQVGWEYNIGPHIRTFKNGKIGWIYFDRSKGHYRVTSGIKPQYIVVGAASTARSMIARRIREALR